MQEAINAVPDMLGIVTEIYIKAGVYKERINISREKTNVTLIGEDANKTILTGDDYATKPDSSGKALGTSKTASLYAMAGFTAKILSSKIHQGRWGRHWLFEAGG